MLKMHVLRQIDRINDELDSIEGKICKSMKIQLKGSAPVQENSVKLCGSWGTHTSITAIIVRQQTKLTFPSNTKD